MRTALPYYIIFGKGNGGRDPQAFGAIGPPTSSTLLVDFAMAIILPYHNSFQAILRISSQPSGDFPLSVKQSCAAAVGK